jgi:hypothetical protein
MGWDMGYSSPRILVYNQVSFGTILRPLSWYRINERLAYEGHVSTPTHIPRFMNNTSSLPFLLPGVELHAQGIALGQMLGEEGKADIVALLVPWLDLQSRVAGDEFLSDHCWRPKGAACGVHASKQRLINGGVVYLWTDASDGLAPDGDPLLALVAVLDLAAELEYSGVQALHEVWSDGAGGFVRFVTVSSKLSLRVAD